MQRGEIWRAELPEPVASEPGYRHPVLLIQSNDFTQSRIQTVIAVVLATNLRLAAAPSNVLVTVDDTHLSKDSVVDVSQIIMVDKSLLTERVSRVDERMMLLVEDGVRTVLAL